MGHHRVPQLEAQLSTGLLVMFYSYLDSASEMVSWPLHATPIQTLVTDQRGDAV